jgi:hypothetical protein
MERGPSLARAISSAAGERANAQGQRSASVPEEADDEELLFREGRALGIDQSDRAVRNRLVQVGRFLDLSPGGDDAAVEREARAVGLVDGDVVIRRHVVQMMQLALAKLTPAQLPTEAEIESYYRAHADRFRDSARTSLTHVYLSADRRGKHLEQDAASLLQTLREEQSEPTDGSSRGDPFVTGPQVSGADDAELERIFGAGFASRLAILPERQWSGPVASLYGLHLVWLHERRPPRARSLATVHNQILHELAEEKAAAQLQARVEKLRESWR